MLLIMVLLATLALGLLSLSSITLRQSGATTAMATARQNARLAMMLALAELQKQVGPDQRVTATADIAGAANGSSLGVGASPQNNTSVTGQAKGLSSVQQGTRYWTGVWKNSNTTNPEVEIYTKTPSPSFVQWLVSGNEAANPASMVTPASAVAAVGGSGAVSDARKAVVLVGAATVGQANAANLPHFVSAPLVPISTDGKGISQPNGRYGWWVGDEGVKVRINQPAGDAASAVASYANLSSMRRGWEVAGLTGYPVPAGGADMSLTKLVTVTQGELLAPTLNNIAGGPLGQVFHAATSDSFGVLSNTVGGGLKLDLTAYLAGSLPSAAEANVTNSPVANRNIIPQSIAPSIKGPKWDRLKDFKDAYASSSSGIACKAAARDTDYAVAPVISDLRILMGAKLVPITAPNFKIYPCGKIAIALANPYPFPLKWNTKLDVELKCEMPAGYSTSYHPSCIWEAAGQPAFLPMNSGHSAVFNGALFQIPAGELAPGEAKAYTMTAPAPRATGTGTFTVGMGPFETSDPLNFENSIQLEHGSSNGPGVRLDVRESTITSPLCVELRPAGSTTEVLRRLERFELDNANFSAYQRTIDATRAPGGTSAMTKAFPLMQYSFQLSQPGADYESVLPLLPSNYLGLRGSTLRTFADFNVQATRFRKPITSYNPPPYFMESTDAKSMLPWSPPGGDAGTAFARNLAVTPIGWGGSPFKSRKTVLFSPQQTLVSLSQFQHADLTADDLFVSVGHQPGNAVGNSYATPFVKRSATVQSRTDYVIVPNGYTSTSTTTQNYYDLSYLLNTALWDGYYFSTIPRTGGTEPLNKTLVKVAGSDQSPELLTGLRSAGHLLVSGSFNINCTEKAAWKALLAGSKFRNHAAGGGSTDALYPRSLEQITAGVTPPTGSGDDSYSGFRRLTDAQIDTIAEEIVKQVRLRGPFVSVSQFVNRALVDLSGGIASDKNVMGRSGALQRALDEGGANIKPDGSASAFSDIRTTGSGVGTVSTDALALQAEGPAPRADMAGGRPTGLPNTAYDWSTSSQDLNPGTVASIVADRGLLTDPALKGEQGFRSTGIPGWVTQADVLQVIGSSISARSDTFRIRAYGEAVDAQSGTTTARAWCEAIVQRLPSYVDGANAPSDRGPSLTAVNRSFGRQFSVVSFRWLKSDEI
ncbi:hypothetical protein [Luteolibacter sp. LG18]|uniref:hypothetical protein n=1 Tax=Luteolibacter sp. LG18 TaxID=2819286 RepID=UPI002B28874E|nr:hypothetical protein llg_04510 [Luteolibacter sp. LG18]